MYESLTKYLLEFPGDEKGMWIIDKENDGTPEHPIQMPYVNYSRLVRGSCLAVGYLFLCAFI